MKIRYNHVFIGIAFLLLLSVIVLLLLSYISARDTADAITLPIQDEWQYYGTRFIPWHPEGGGPSWSVMYDAIYVFVTGPISVDVNLVGTVQRTNPYNLIEGITLQKEREARQALKVIGTTVPNRVE